MGAPIAKHLRERVVTAYRAGTGTYKQLAELFGVGEASVDRFLRQARETADLSPAPHSGGVVARISVEQYETLAKLVAEKPDRTVLELRDE